MFEHETNSTTPTNASQLLLTRVFVIETIFAGLNCVYFFFLNKLSFCFTRVLVLGSEHYHHGPSIADELSHRIPTGALTPPSWR